ncbi:MAG: SRPBCC family protein [Nitriliruptoraceae bacterium]
MGPNRVRRRRGLVAAGVAALAAVLATRGTRHLGAHPAEVVQRHPGAHPAEVVRRHAGDERADPADRVSTRAVTIAAPASQVWPWLVQLGYRRGGWYAIDALEAAIGAGTRSARTIRPDLQQLAVGDRVPLSDRAHLLVHHLEVARSLVLVLPDAPLAWVWSFRLLPVPGGCRLVVRTSIGARRWWVRPLLPLLEAGHAVMELVQLRTIRRRVHACAADPPAGRASSPTRPGRSSG